MSSKCKARAHQFAIVINVRVAAVAAVAVIVAHLCLLLQKWIAFTGAAPPIAVIVTSSLGPEHRILALDFGCIQAVCISSS